MGFLSIAMALLTAAGALAGMTLAGEQRWPALVSGATIAMALLAIAWLTTEIGRRLDMVAAEIRETRLNAARLAAICGNIVPVAALCVGCVWSFVQVGRSNGPAVTLLLWSYLIATGPPTLLAALAPRATRTLLGLRAFGMQIGYVQIVITTELIGAPLALAVTIMAVWACVPITMGYVMALASPEILRNVRI